MKKNSIPGDYQYRALAQGGSIQRFWHDNKFTLLDTIGDFSAQDIVLDAGCGSGNISFHLAPKVKKVIGLDVNKEAVIFASHHAKKLGVKNAVFKVADLKKIPYPENYFTKVILFEVVEHLDELEYQEILAEVRRVMKRSGLLYLTTPNKVSSWPAIEWALDTFRLTFLMRSVQHILEFTFSQLKRILIEHQFKLICFGSMNHLSPFISSLSWRLAKKVANIEINYFQRLGPIIWLVARK